MFSKKAKKIDEIFTVALKLTNVCPAGKRTKRSSNILLCLVRFYAGQMLHNVKLTEKISSNYVAFLKNMNFTNLVPWV